MQNGALKLGVVRGTNININLNGRAKNQSIDVYGSGKYIAGDLETAKSGIPISMLYAVPNCTSPSASSSKILKTGTDNVLYILGWLDLSKGLQVLHVSDFSGRYYSVQFTDPFDIDFAYVGTCTTGT